MSLTTHSLHDLNFVTSTTIEKNVTELNVFERRLLYIYVQQCMPKSLETSKDNSITQGDNSMNIVEIY